AAFTDNPESAARRKDSMDKKRGWRRDSIWQDSNLHLLGFRPSALSQLSYTLLMVEDNQRSAAHRNRSRNRGVLIPPFGWTSPPARSPFCGQREDSTGATLDSMRTNSGMHAHRLTGCSHVRKSWN